MAIVGAGNVGTALALALHEAQVPVVQVVSRRLETARAVAAEIGDVPATDRLADLAPEASLVLLTLPDDALPQAVAQLSPLQHPAVFAHTAGSVPLDVLAPLGERVGVFYPLQTFTKGRQPNWGLVPIFLEGSPGALRVLNEVANRISHHVGELSSEHRATLHLGAVFAANFVNWMLVLAERILETVPGLDHRVYQPLLGEVIEKLQNFTPEAAQTGPARRGDAAVLAQHLGRLQPPMHAVYALLSAQIQAHYSAPSVSPGTASANKEANAS